MTNSRFQEAIAMSIDRVDRSFISDTDMVRLDPDQLSVFLVGFIYTLVAFSLSGLEHQPQVGELRKQRARNISDTSIGSEIWDNPEEDESDGDCVRGEDEVSDRHFGDPR